MEKTLQVGVKILLQGSDGKYLLLLRSKDVYPDVNDAWDIPGGRITPGFTLLENLDRELNEEIGQGLEGTPHLIAAQDIIKEDKHVVRLTYLGSISEQPKLNNKEHSEFKWFSREDLLKLDGLDHYLKELLEKNIV